MFFGSILIRVQCTLNEDLQKTALIAHAAKCLISKASGRFLTLNQVLTAKSLIESTDLLLTF